MVRSFICTPNPLPREILVRISVQLDLSQQESGNQEQLSAKLLSLAEQIYNAMT
jgi:hypothetical protein